MNKRKLTLQDLIKLIDVSVQSKNIQKDYSDFLNYCRDCGLSSYILNLIIQKSSKREHEDNVTNTIDKSFWNTDKDFKRKNEEEIISLKNKISSLHSELKRARNLSDTATNKSKKKLSFLCIALLISMCVVAFLGYKYRIDSINNERRVVFAKKEISKFSQNIIEVPTDSMVLEDWTSINTTDNTHSECEYNFYAFRGDTLKYDYKVSSESGYDILTIDLSGNTFKNYTLTNASGIAQSVRTYIFKADGQYTFRAVYRKDGSYSRNQDKAWVWNIEILRDSYIKRLIELKEYCDSINKKI